MSRFFVCFCLPAICASGCRLATTLPQEHAQSRTEWKVPLAIEQITKVVAPRVPPPETNLATSNHRQDSFYNAARPILRTEPESAPKESTAREPEEIPQPTEACQSNRDAPAKDAASSSALKKVPDESRRAENQKSGEKTAEKTASSPSAVFTGLSYLVGTVFGTVFTCIFAPVIVEVLKTRIGNSRNRQKA